jgi:hypothetical protein
MKKITFSTTLLAIAVITSCKEDAKTPGKYWGDVTSPEIAQGKPFTTTFVYGTYGMALFFSSYFNNLFI